LVPHIDDSRYRNYVHLAGYARLSAPTKGKPWFKAAWAFLGLVLVMGAVGIGRHLWWPRPEAPASGVWFAWRVVAVVSAPAALSRVMIFPRCPYLILLIALLLVLATTGLRWAPLLQRCWARLDGRVPLVLLAIVLVLVVPNRSRGWNLQTWVGFAKPKPVPDDAIARTVATARAGAGRGPQVLLDTDRIYAAYLGPHCRLLYPEHLAPGEQFGEFVQRLGITLVLVSPQLESHPRLREDPSFREFVHGPHPGFRFVPVAGSPMTVAIRQSDRSSSGKRAP